jgi:hypothetical protein
MSLPASTDIQLTPEQSKVLGKLKAYSNYANFLPRLDLFLPRSRQISLFDFMKQIFSATGNRNVFDTLLKQFINTVLNPNSNLLERKVLEAIARSCDEKKIILSNQKLSNGKFRYSADGGLTPSNKEFLTIEILPFFSLSKEIIMAEIMALIFGPPSNIKKFNPTFTDEQAAEYASCAGSLYTISNLPNQGVGDIEYNKAELKKQVQNGGIVFEISCQQIVIKLPENYTTIFFPVNTIPGQSKSSFNPDVTFQLIENFVKKEVARQNIPDNENSAAKSFRESFIEKFLNTITFSVVNQLGALFDLIEQKGAPVEILNGPLTNLAANAISKAITNQIQNATNQQPTTRVITRTELESFIKVSPCDVYNVGLRQKSGQNVDNEKNRYLIFATFLINAILGILLSILIRRLIKEVKGLLIRVIAKKSSDLAKRLARKRLAIYEAYFNAGKEEVERKIKLANALGKLTEIIKSF